MPLTRRSAGRAQVREMADVLARAFGEDPPMAWLFPDLDTRPARLRHLWQGNVLKSLPCGTTEVVTDTNRILGVALWEPPGRGRTPATSELTSMPHYVRALGRRLRQGAMFVQALAEARPNEPHWYLAGLGTEPAAQGRGVGSALLRSKADQCDAADTAAYLETNTETNVRFYERFGFAVTGEIPIADGGPRTWAMWRAPR